MALATRCPHCQTTFRVANDQLKLHAGLVRCGSCRQTFNGVEHLVPAAGSQSAVRAQAAPPPASPPAIAAIALQPETASLPKAAAEFNPAAATTDGTADQTAAATANATAGLTETQPDIAALAPEPDAPPAFALPDETPAPAAAQPEAGMLPATGEDRQMLPTSASAMDFVFGEQDSDAPFTDAPPEAVAARVELETRAALAEPDTSWSLADQSEGEPGMTAAGDDYHANEPHMPEALPAETAMYADSPPDSLSEPYMDALPEAAAEAASIVSDPLTGEIDSSFAEHEKPDFVLQAEREQRHGRRKKIAMTLASLLLLPLAAAQLAYALRVPLAANLPASKPALTTMCQMLGCDIPLPAQIDQIIIESNEMLEQSPGLHVYSLTVQLHNQSGVTQAWPQLELVLNDKKDKALLQKTFTPAEYLDHPADAGKGFAPGSVQNIKLYFNLPKLNAAGYHVGVFYP